MSFSAAAGQDYAILIPDGDRHRVFNRDRFPEYVTISQVAAVVRYQDPATGLWYQVIDQGHRAGNCLEASATGMFAYALAKAKAARLGYIDHAYWQTADQALQGMIEHLATANEAGLVELNQICSVAGLGGDPYRDGSFAYYVGEPVATNDDKGVGLFILASVELEM